MARLQIFIWFILLVGCKVKDPLNEIEEGNKTFLPVLPVGFPSFTIPEDNQLTRNRVDLGRMLFFDPIMSRDSTVSCQSCHKPELYFADGLPKSIGINGRVGLRNSPSLINVAYQPNMFWDGGNPNLEQQVVAPIDSHVEFDFDINKIVERLKKHKTYSSFFQKAYNQEPTVFALTRALAAYQRTLIGGTSKYDDFVKNNHDSTLFTAEERNGLRLFFAEKGECFHCHQGFAFSDFSFRNNGLYSQYPDSGRARITGVRSDVGKFKVPSLRNVEKTAPYMHDGSLQTLEQVLDHYASGGKRHPNKSPIIVPLPLTDQDKKDIIAFLKTLTDKVVVQ